VELAENGSLAHERARGYLHDVICFISDLRPTLKCFPIFWTLASEDVKGLFLLRVQQIYPEIEALSIEFIAGEPMLHASVHAIQGKQAVANLSGGMNKYLSIVVSILAFQRGAVVIDELENGSIMPTFIRLFAAL